MDHEQNSEDHARNVSDCEIWNSESRDSWVMREDDTPLTLDKLKARTLQVHVDQVRDMVPFWMKGVQAAEKGEVLRLEDFLEKLASEDRWGVADVGDPWGPSIGPWPADHPWGAAVPGGREDPWNKDEENPWGKDEENPWGKVVEGPWGTVDDPWGKVANWAVDEDSTLSMHAGRSVSHHREDRRRHKNVGKGKSRKHLTQGHERRSLQDPHVFVEDIARQQAVDAERKRRMHDFYEVCSIMPIIYDVFSSNADADSGQG
jgi:hypothetical protein